jgi:hypothetical protein
MTEHELLRVRAIHEGGHVVAAHSFGRVIDYASLHAEEGGGAVRYFFAADERRALLNDPEGEGLRYAKEAATISLAGPVARGVAQGEHAPFRLRDLAELYGGCGDVPNARRAIEAAVWFCPDQDLRPLIRRAEGLVANEWPLIQLLAAKLVERGELSGAEIGRILRPPSTASSLRGPTLRRIDPRKHTVVVQGRRLSLRAWADVLDVTGHRAAKTPEELTRMLEVARTRMLAKTGGR